MGVVRGVVDAVYSETAGVALVDAAPAGSSTVMVGSAVDLSADGGTLMYADDAGTLYSVAYTGWAEQYSADYDDLVTVVSLADGLAVDVPAGALMACQPPRVRVVASVTVGEDSDALSATVPYTMRALLPVGIRSDRETAEQVVVEWRGSECVVVDVIDKTPVIDGSAVVLGDIHLGDMLADAAAQVATVASAVAGKADVTYAATPPGDAVGKSGDTWRQLSTDGSGIVAEWRHDGTGWVAAPLDGGALVPGSVDAAQLRAGSVVAGKIAAGAVTADTLAARMVLGSQIIAGDPSSGTYAQMDGTGITLHSPGPDGSDLVSGSLGVPGEGDYLQLYDASGDPAASIGSNGNVTARTVDTDSLSIGGYDFNDILEMYPRGAVVWGRRWTEWTANTSDNPVMSCTASVGARRLLRISVTNFWVRFYAAGKVTVVLKYRFNGGAEVQIASGAVSGSSGAVLFPGLTAMLPMTATDTSDLQFIVYAKADAGAPTILAQSGAYLPAICVEDMGPYMPDSIVEHESPAGTTQAAPPAPAKTTYTTTWSATGTGSYRGDGSKRSDTTDMVQGTMSPNGNQYSMSVFGGGATASTSSGEVGKTISAALTGATVSKVEAWLYFSHWYGQTGAARLLAGAASTVPATGTPPTGTVVESTGWPRGAGRWVPIGSNAATRSVWLAQPPSSSTVYYGRAGGAGGAQAYAPKLRITYTR